MSFRAWRVFVLGLAIGLLLSVAIMIHALGDTP